MIFNSLEFALFFPLIYIFYIAIYRKEKGRDILLLVASYFFYMCWYWQYVGLIALSTILDFYISRSMGKTKDKHIRKLLLIVSLTVNLGILCLFKYFNFFVDTGVSMAEMFGFEINRVFHQLLLPVGISFYTFQTLSYTIDIYKKEIEPEKSLLKFAVFVSFFPQLVAGPIVRAKEFLPQLNMPNLKPTQEGFNFGLVLILLGLFKKIVVADLLAFLAVDAIFLEPEKFSSWDLL